MPVLVIADLHLDMWLGAQRDPLAAIRGLLPEGAKSYAKV